MPADPTFNVQYQQPTDEFLQFLKMFAQANQAAPPGLPPIPPNLPTGPAFQQQSATMRPQAPTDAWGLANQIATAGAQKRALGGGY